MKAAREVASQTNKPRLVKLCVAAVLLAVLAPPHAFPQSDAQDPWSEAPPPPPPPTAPVTDAPPPPPEETLAPPAEASSTTPPAPAAAEPTIQIEARSFAVTTVKRSQSLRVYQIEDKSGELPVEGKILLLRRGVIPIMGLKVIKLYPESRSFAAKRMQIYDNRRALDLNENFEAIEKTGEILITPPTPQDQADLKEIEASAPPPPPPAPTEGMPGDPPPPPPEGGPEGEIPAPPPEDIPPPPDAGADAEAAQAQDALPLESHNALVVEEVKPLDPHRHWVSALVGAMANYNPTGSVGYFTTVGARYGITLAKSVFLDGMRVQDSIVLEAGASLYQISGYQENVGDSYTVVPVSGTLRYNFQITELFGIFLYGGIVKNFITASASADIVGTTYLDSIIPAVGGGAYVTMGPSWNLRFDAGFDTFAAGLMLRF